jgi:hypothetical protein
MATTTPNYGWTVPTSTDLVKDGATAIETLGDAIDASMNTALGTKKAGMVLLNTTSFSAVASQSINDVFSATYDVYLIQYGMTASVDNGFTMRLRVGGSDDSTGSAYVYQLLNANTTTVSAARTTSNIWSMGGVDNDLVSSATIKLTNPFKASATGMEARFLNAAAGGIVNDYVGTHNQNTSYTGFSAIASTGNFTGYISVYGYNK